MAPPHGAVDGRACPQLIGGVAPAHRGDVARTASSLPASARCIRWHHPCGSVRQWRMPAAHESGPCRGRQGPLSCCRVRSWEGCYWVVSTEACNCVPASGLPSTVPTIDAAARAVVWPRAVVGGEFGPGVQTTLIGPPEPCRWWKSSNSSGSRAFKGFHRNPDNRRRLVLRRLA